VVISTDCTGNCKSNCHVITNTTTPSTNKTDLHDITVILLKVALNTNYPFYCYLIFTFILFYYKLLKLWGNKCIKTLVKCNTTVSIDTHLQILVGFVLFNLTSSYLGKCRYCRYDFRMKATFDSTLPPPPFFFVRCLWFVCFDMQVSDVVSVSGDADVAWLVCPSISSNFLC
jgi:hypothetical protein